MYRLSNEDCNKICKLMEELPLMQTYRGRRRLLEYAGLKQVISQIDLEGNPFIVSGEIISALEVFGRVTYEHESLGMLLNTIKEFLGSYDGKTAFIDKLLKDYDLMRPVKKLEKPTNWKTKFDYEDTLEKVIGENTLRHISFLEHGIKAARSVAFIEMEDGMGTGFMISPNLLLTNNHVIPNKRLLGKTKVRFNYQLSLQGREEKTTDYTVKASGIFRTNEELDYTVVQIDGSSGDNWGYVTLNPMIVETDSRVNIIQHPAGQPKQVSFQNNFVEYADSKIVQYITSTMNGSSGAPVFDDTWKVVALHHAGGMMSEPGTNRRYFRNEGIAIKAILKDFPDNIRNLL